MPEYGNIEDAVFERNSFLEGGPDQFAEVDPN
jgi:hypothetical protein